ncbi:MAG: hypothetical protein WBM55_00540 [Muriicola sp.]
MNETVRKIGSLMMALLVLFSTMSFSMDMHFCGDSLVDFKFYQKAETCGMSMDMPMRDMMSDDMEMHCCSDVEVVLTGQDDLQLSIDQFSFEQQTFILAYTFAYIYLFDKVNDQPIPFKEYSPPILIKDVQLMDQTFLI